MKVHTIALFAFTTTALADEDQSRLAVLFSSGPTKTVDEFCGSLESLESHLTENLNNLFGGSGYLEGTYDCKCAKNQQDDKTFDVDCIFEYDASIGGGSNFEKMTFVQVANNEAEEYKLSRTSWGDSLYGESVPQEVFDYDVNDGKLSSCEGNGCASCSICDDDKSVAMDCSTLVPADLAYTYECSDWYTGSFANTFEFGKIIISSHHDNDNAGTEGEDGTRIGTEIEVNDSSSTSSGALQSLTTTSSFGVSTACLTLLSYIFLL